MQASLLNGDQETGISILKMDEELDHGPIYILRKVRIEKEDNFEMLTKKLSEIGSVLLPATLFDIASQDLSPITQSHQQASFCQKINKGDGEIDFNSKNAEEIHNMIRAYTPWPSSYCEYKGKKLKILEAEFEDNISLKPGEFKVEGKTLSIGTKKGVLIPKKLQPEGKKPMDVGSFINGLS